MGALIDNLLLGFRTATSLTNLLLCALGCLIGTLIGVLPGIGPVATIAMLLPLTFDVPHPNLTMDIQMMTLLGGRERSVSEWSELLQQSGWKLSTRIETNAGFALIEGKPN